MHEIPPEHCLAYYGTLMMMIVIMKVMIISEYYSLTTHNQSRVTKQRIRKFLTSRGKNNGSLSWFTQYIIYWEINIYYMPSTDLVAWGTEVMKKEET